MKEIRNHATYAVKRKCRRINTKSLFSAIDGEMVLARKLVTAIAIRFNFASEPCFAKDHPAARANYARLHRRLDAKKDRRLDAKKVCRWLKSAQMPSFDNKDLLANGFRIMAYR